MVMAELDESEFDGSLVLEQLAAIGRVDDFFEAVDADDLEEAEALMLAADIDRPTIDVVLRKMAEGDAEP